MTARQEAYLLGFLNGTRRPGTSTIHHRDRQVIEDAARLLNLVCKHRKIPHAQLHHPERPLHGTVDETVLTLPAQLLKEVDRPLAELFEQFRSVQSDLERGILEGCGTLCYKKATRGIGISFTSFDEGWLKALLAEISQHHACSPIQKTERERFWFGIEDSGTGSYAEWLYHDPNAPHSISRRRKLQQVLEQVRRH